MAGKIKKDWKFWLNVFTFVALAALIIISRHQIVDAFRNLSHLKFVWLFLMVPLQLVNYYAVARLYHDYFKSQGDTIRFRKLYSVALELNFINHVFPSGGLSGFSYLSLRLKQEGIATSKSTLAQIIRFVMTFISFLALLFVGMLVLALQRRTSPLTILLSSTIAFMTLFGTLVAVYVISDEDRIKVFLGFLPKAVNKVLRPFRSKRNNLIDMEKVEHTLASLHTDYTLLSKDLRALKRPLFWAFVVNVTDIATAYVVYIAFGTLINPGALIIAYAVANFAGLVAILPGGVGVYEGLMTAVLATAGVEKALALSATVMYRVLNLIIFLPIGYILYNRALAKTGMEELPEDHHEPTSFVSH